MKVLLALLVCLAYVSAPAEGAEKKNVVCYFTNWSIYRPSNGRFTISDIDVSLCTHIIYAFVGLNENGTVLDLDTWRDQDDGLKGFSEFIALKEKKPSLKLVISMGGWGEGSAKYSTVVGNATLRQNMVNSVVEFVNQWGFDGFDLDWEYPGLREGSDPADKENLILLLKELRKPLKAAGKILCMAVSPAKEKIEVAYDIPKLSRYLDMINVMTYDFHVSADNFVGHVAPLYPSSLDDEGNATYTVSAAIKVWLDGGVEPSKLHMGIPAYGISFTLADENETGLYAPITGGGTAGPYSLAEGSLDYKEICEFASNWTYVWDSEQKVPHRVSGDQWVGYDDERSIKLKVEYARRKQLGGIMVWSVDADDFRGTCGDGTYPLLNAINKNLYK